MQTQSVMASLEHRGLQHHHKHGRSHRTGLGAGCTLAERERYGPNRHDIQDSLSCNGRASKGLDTVLGAIGHSLTLALSVLGARLFFKKGMTMTEKKVRLTVRGNHRSPRIDSRRNDRARRNRVDGEDIYWIESRPSEGGRSVIVRRTPDGAIADMTPAGFNARTTVHEYGGGAYFVDAGPVYFSNFADQRLYRQIAG